MPWSPKLIVPLLLCILSAHAFAVPNAFIQPSPKDPSKCISSNSNGAARLDMNCPDFGGRVPLHLTVPDSHPLSFEVHVTPKLAKKHCRDPDALNDVRATIDIQSTCNQCYFTAVYSSTRNKQVGWHFDADEMQPVGAFRVDLMNSAYFELDEKRVTMTLSDGTKYASKPSCRFGACGRGVPQNAYELVFETTDTSCGIFVDFPKHAVLLPAPLGPQTHHLLEPLGLQEHLSESSLSADSFNITPTNANKFVDVSAKLTFPDTIQLPRRVAVLPTAVAVPRPTKPVPEPASSLPYAVSASAVPTSTSSLPWIDGEKVELTRAYADVGLSLPANEPLRFKLNIPYKQTKDCRSFAPLDRPQRLGDIKPYSAEFSSLEITAGSCLLRAKYKEYKTFEFEGVSLQLELNNSYNYNRDVTITIHSRTATVSYGSEEKNTTLPCELPFPKNVDQKSITLNLKAEIGFCKSKLIFPNSIQVESVKLRCFKQCSKSNRFKRDVEPKQGSTARPNAVYKALICRIFLFSLFLAL